MKKELDDLLCRKYPKIFAQRNGSPSETNMCWGFPGDGWFEIINWLCGAIQDHCDNVKYFLDGEMRSPEQVVAVQVKEKFGKLRFYFDGGDETIHGMVEMAEYMSGTICEECGKPGKLRTDRGWIRTLCDEHAKIPTR